MKLEILNHKRHKRKTKETQKVIEFTINADQ